MAVLLANNVASTLALSLTATATSLRVATGAGSRFPSPTGSDYFYLTIVSTTGEVEVVKVTSRVNDVMTIVRAQDNTTAKNFPANSRVEVRINAQSVKDTATDTVAPVSTALTALTARVTTAESDIDALQAADIALDARLDTAESDIDALQAADIALDARLDTAESDIDTLQVTVAQLPSEIDEQVAIATSQATAATNAKIAAELAAAASLASAAYTTTAAGLAATTADQIFLLSTANFQIYSIYRNNAGTAQLLGSLNVADGALFVKETLINFAWSVIDDVGNAAIGVTDDGTFEAAAANIDDLTVSTINSASAGGLALASSSTTGTTPSGYQWTVQDEDGLAAIGVADDGTFKADVADITDLTINSLNSIEAANLVLAASSTTSLTPSGYQWSVQDDDGLAAIGVKDDGTFASSVAAVGSLTVDEINGVPTQDIIDGVYASDQGDSFIAEVNHIPTYGQSLSILGDPVVTTTQPYDSIEFNTAQTAFAPLTAVVPPMGTGETPAPGTGHAIKQLIASENSILYTDQAYQLLFSVDGQSGTTATQLSKPSTPYSRLIASVQAGFDVSQGLGKSFNVPAITWTQGESDQNGGTPADTYKSILTTFLNDFDADAKAITSQSNDVKMIMYQMATHKYFSAAYPSIALAQLAFAKENPKVFMATPMYQFDYVDNLHVDGASAKKLGFYYGLVYKRVIVDGLSWKPLMPISKYKQGLVAIVKFHVPYGKLVFDTTTVAANTNYGFNLFDSGGTELTINSVSIVGPNTVKIAAASTIPAGAKLRYAFYGSGTAGRTNGPRGNLRDTQGTSIVFDPAGLNYPAHNWCVMFEEIF